MILESLRSGKFISKAWDKEYPRIQILTIEDLLLHGAKVEMPPQSRMFVKSDFIPDADQPPLI
jgi:hypothetical protein